MELADSVYTYNKLKANLKNDAPKINNEIYKPLSSMSEDINKIDFKGINSPLGSRVALDSCDLPICKSIRLLDDLIKCQGPICDSARSALKWIKNGPSDNGVCNDPLCSITSEIDQMLDDPKNCDNGLCNLIRSMVGENFLTNILMEILNFILGPFKRPFITLLIIIVTAILIMFSILLYLVFFK